MANLPASLLNEKLVHAFAFIGMVIGLALAFTAVTTPAQTALPANVVAKINDSSIEWRDYRQALAQLNSERRSPLTAEQKQRVLDKLINEELLVQHAIALGIVEQDRNLRSRLVGQVMAMQRQMAESAEPTEAELAAFYQNESEFFKQPGRYRVSIDYCAGTSAQQRAEAFAAQPIGANACGDSGGPYLPNAALPTLKLRSYLGPRLADAIVSLPVEQQTTAALRYGQGWMVATIVNRQPARKPELAEIRAQVRQEWQRRQGEALLKSLLTQLRAEANIQLADDQLADVKI